MKKLCWGGLSCVKSFSFMFVGTGLHHAFSWFLDYVVGEHWDQWLCIGRMSFVGFFCFFFVRWVCLCLSCTNLLCLLLCSREFIWIPVYLGPRDSIAVKKKEKKTSCVFISSRMRERERESVCVCLYVCTYMCAHRCWSRRVFVCLTSELHYKHVLSPCMPVSIGIGMCLYLQP